MRDPGWIDVEIESDLVPVRLHLPPALAATGELFTPTPASAVYIAVAAGHLATLQVGVDAVRSPADFARVIASLRGTVTPEVRQVTFLDRDAVVGEGTVVLPQPRALLQEPGGRVSTAPASLSRARWRSYFVPLDGERVLRAGYCLPEHEVEAWERVLSSVLEEITWSRR